MLLVVDYKEVSLNVAVLDMYFFNQYGCFLLFLFIKSIRDLQLLTYMHYSQGFPLASKGSALPHIDSIVFSIGHAWKYDFLLFFFIKSIWDLQLLTYLNYAQGFPLASKGRALPTSSRKKACEFIYF